MVGLLFPLARARALNKKRGKKIQEKESRTMNNKMSTQKSMVTSTIPNRSRNEGTGNGVAWRRPLVV